MKLQHCLWTLLLVGCTGDGAVVETEDEASLDAQPTIISDRSVLITNLSAFKKVEDEFSFGALFSDIADEAIHVWSTNPGASTKFANVNEWVEFIFDSADKEWLRHNALPAYRQLGVVGKQDPFQHIKSLWPALANADVGAGPFRLLAVVNRMDLAGDVDARDCCVAAAKNPRPFGEGRLIFGVVDKAYENAHGKPYPMTFIVEYRLPALDASYQPIENMEGIHTSVLGDRDAWRDQMQRWAHLWRALSAWDPESTDPEEVTKYRSRLVQLVRRFARPENFVSLRSSFVVEDAQGNKEVELREWYILKNLMTLIPHKVRREPYRCAQAGSDLGRLVRHQWVAAKNDLRMVGVNPADLQESTSYDLPRDHNNAPIVIANPINGCPRDASGDPILAEMKAEGGDHLVLAPFARMVVGQVWKLDGSTEAQRHAFAIRTCSGCHGAEAGISSGFHVSPRLAGQESRLSSFLLPGAGVEFRHGGVDYRYEELTKRTRWLQKASERDGSLVLYDSLYRHDAL